MGKPTGFMEYERQAQRERDPLDRTKDWNEYTVKMSEKEIQQQGARCMDCGVPTCHTGIEIEGVTTGCPVYHLIPEWNDLVYQGQWKEALKREHEMNNFPEFTGVACPAPCEGACVLGINEPPVAIRTVERAIIEKGFEEVHSKEEFGEFQLTLFPMVNLYASNLNEALHLFRHHSH